MLTKLFVLFVIVPAIELYLLIEIGQRIGGIETLGIILATGMLGSVLAKSQGISTWMKLQTKLTSGQIPGKELVDGVIILISAAFLITPGILTDLVGLLGLLPVTRALFRKWLFPRVSNLFGRQMSNRTANQSVRFDSGSNFEFRTEFNVAGAESKPIDLDNGFRESASGVRGKRPPESGDDIDISGHPNIHPRHQN